ncbi:MAG: hypothetical protein K6B14_04285 [Lachnospiraceae bacterium]|nr:hypothetical protein [Lachnospiraceae bacterium]
MDDQEKLKQIPIITMLFAAGLTAVISLFSEITFGMFLLRIFIASISFYLIGTVAQILFAKALNKDEQAKKKDGADDGAEVAAEPEEPHDYPDEEEEEDEGL